jgi:hypothetical protein
MENVPKIVQGHTRKEAKCPKCGKMVSTMGMGGHMRFVHKTEIGRQGRPLENLVQAKVQTRSAFAPPEIFEDLAEFLLKMFNGDDKQLVKAIKDKKKELDAE